MKEELDKQLCEKYPKIFANRHGSPQETCMCWGIATGDGWYGLIDRLCANLQWNTDKNNFVKDGVERYPQVVAAQVKEKFGGLRFYVESATSEQYAVISFAESLSEHVCDVCGHPGTSGGDGWISTRCDLHRTHTHTGYE
jgi:hypothetical protein